MLFLGCCTLKRTSHRRLCALRKPRFRSNHYIRFRPAALGVHCVQIHGSSDIVLDHCSLSSVRMKTWIGCVRLGQDGLPPRLPVRFITSLITRWTTASRQGSVCSSVCQDIGVSLTASSNNRSKSDPYRQDRRYSLGRLAVTERTQWGSKWYSRKWSSVMLDFDGPCAELSHRLMTFLTKHSC
jgi:hypothetical protein